MRKKRNFRGQSGTRPNKGKNPNPSPRATGAGSPVGCVCGNDFTCVGYQELDYMGQLWDNCSCCFRTTGKGV
jgi:hypothetical protein